MCNCAHNSLQGLNLKHLDTILTTTLEQNGCELPGVTRPYLYFGTARSVFAWCVHACMFV